MLTSSRAGFLQAAGRENFCRALLTSSKDDGSSSSSASASSSSSATAAAVMDLEKRVLSDLSDLSSANERAEATQEAIAAKKAEIAAADSAASDARLRAAKEHNLVVGDDANAMLERQTRKIQQLNADNQRVADECWQIESELKPLASKEVEMPMEDATKPAEMEELKQIKQWYRAFNRMLASVGGASVLEHTERDGVEGVRITLTPGSIGQRAGGGGGGGASKMRHVLSIQFKAGLTEGGFDVAAASLKSDVDVFVDDVVAASASMGERGLGFLVHEVRQRIGLAIDRDAKLHDLSQRAVVHCSALASADPQVQVDLPCGTCVLARLSPNYAVADFQVGPTGVDTAAAKRISGKRQQLAGGVSLTQLVA